MLCSPPVVLLPSAAAPPPRRRGRSTKPRFLPLPLCQAQRGGGGDALLALSVAKEEGTNATASK